MYILRCVRDYDEAAGRGVNERLDLAFDDETINNNTSDDYYTPPFIFKALNLQFDLDVSGPAGGGVPWLPAKKTFNVIDDGLAQEWHGRVWMNPPYSDPKPWVNKFIAHGNGVALIPTSTGAWMLTFWKSNAKWLMLPPIKFVKSNLESAKGFMPIRCWLLAIGSDNVEAMRQSNLGFVR